MNETTACEQLPDHLLWRCDGCNFVISEGKEYVAVEACSRVRRDGKITEFKKVIRPQYFCRNCADHLDFSELSIPQLET